MTSAPLPRAIVLDFDGVIADTERLHWEAFNVALNDIGVRVEEEAYYARYMGMDDRAAMMAMAADAGRPADPALSERLLRRKESAYLSQLDSGVGCLSRFLLPGAADFIRVEAGRRPLAVCSAARRCEIEAILFAADLVDCFQTIVAVEDVPRPKPDPAGYLRAVALLAEHARGLQPSECIAVEDSVFGLTAARAAGLKTIGVLTRHSKECLSPLADRVAADLRAVDDIVMRSLF